MTNKPFDLSGKELLEMDPAAFVALAGIAIAAGVEVTVIDAELSSVTAASDKLIRIGSGPGAFLIHFEFQSRRDPDLGLRMAAYNVLARLRQRIPVWSVAILFRPEAAPRVTGQYVARDADGRTRLLFEYDVVRVWELPAGPLLTGSVAMLPFAPVAAVPPDQVAAVVEQVKGRLLAELPLDRAKVLGHITEYLLGLYFDDDQVEALMGTFAELLQDSSVYKAQMRRLREGEARGIIKGRQDAILQFAADKLGEPSAESVARVRAVTVGDELDGLMARLRTAATWEQLLGGD